MVDIEENCKRVWEQIAGAAERSRRDPKEIKLLAASKFRPVGEIEAAFRAGIHLFGENYVQEAKEKKEALGELVEWHMIGHLQRNKAKLAVELFTLIESLDSIELARALDREGKRRGCHIRTFVEVNLGGESSKSGIPKRDLVPLLEQVGNLSHLKVEGLMIIPPVQDDPEEARPFFRALRELRSELQELRIDNVDLRELSMGMTHDYVTAIEEGSTLVRVGTAIFGQRREG